MDKLHVILQFSGCGVMRLAGSSSKFSRNQCTRLPNYSNKTTVLIPHPRLPQIEYSSVWLIFGETLDPKL
jgi:hypothetical protein